MIQRQSVRGFSKRLRAFVWPKKGFIRAWKYLAVRLSRLKKSPHAIAAGAASGVAASFSPLLGLHIVLAGVLTFITRGSMVAALVGTLIGNPLTFPIFFSATYWVGARVTDLAATEPSQALDKIAEGLDDRSEAEADAAADAVLDAAENMIEDGWSFAAIDVIWPVLSTMMIGAAILIPFIYALSYLAIRALLNSFGRRSGHQAQRHP
ncbi:MAG: DUF2062 domain-containing protein [Rhodobacteraceae bacterium]|jgi:uncharacterized protein (DUF2062 family)|nr:DUF2062 domain-containing protein [Paracoccaceae bacterium]